MWGTQGGYVLNKKAKEIKLTNIFDAVDEKVKLFSVRKNLRKVVMVNLQNV